MASRQPGDLLARSGLASNLAPETTSPLRPFRTTLTAAASTTPAFRNEMPSPAEPVTVTCRRTTVADPCADRPVDELVNVVQGTGPRGVIATLYFDQQSGLLLRVVRYGKSPIGRVPTQVDYGDYREVNGIKMPFRMIFAWMDGRDAIQLDNVQVNVPIEAAQFGRPPALHKGN